MGTSAIADPVRDPDDGAGASQETSSKFEASSKCNDLDRARSAPPGIDAIDNTDDGHGSTRAQQADAKSQQTLSLPAASANRNCTQNNTCDDSAAEVCAHTVSMQSGQALYYDIAHLN